MELEEIRKEARKHGYYLYKSYDAYEHLKPCPSCGHNRRDHFMTSDSETGKAKYGMRCVKCRFTVTEFSKRKLRKKWNKVASEKED